MTFLIVMRLVGVVLGLFVLASGYLFGLWFGNVRLMWNGIISGVIVFVQFWVTGSRWTWWVLGVGITWAAGNSLVGWVLLRRSEKRYRRERAERLAEWERVSGRPQEPQAQ